MKLPNILGLFAKKKDNNVGADIASVFFMGKSPSYANIQSYDSLIGAATLSYNMTVSVGKSNTIVSRFIDVISSSIQGIAVYNKAEDEVNSALANKIISDVKSIRGAEEDLGEYIYKSINSFVCCGMKVSAPTIADESGYAQKIEVLDPRRVNLIKKGFEYELSYNGQKVQTYHKKVIKPNLDRTGYGECLFSGAIKDALLDIAARDQVVFHYKNGAKPGEIYRLKSSGGGILQEEDIKKFENSLIERHQGTDKAGLPLASTIVDNVFTVDGSASLIKSVDMRLFSSNMLGLQLGVDIRGLGFMRNGGSQAELYAVMDQLNGAIERYCNYLSKSITAEYKGMVSDIGDLSIKFIPKYYKNSQQVIDNALKAEKQGCVDKKYVQDLIYNNN